MPGLLDWFDSGTNKRRGLLGISPDALDALGIDPAAVRGQTISNILGALGAGLLSGRNWSEGMALGFSGAADAGTRARDDALKGGLLSAELNEEIEKRRREEAARARIAEITGGDGPNAAATPAGAGLPVTFDPRRPPIAEDDTMPTGIVSTGSDAPIRTGLLSPRQRDALGAWGETDPLGAIEFYNKQAFEDPALPDAPTVKDFYEGGVLIQKQYDPSAKRWIEVGRGPRWQAPQGPADAGAWETVDLPGVGKVQRNKRTGKIEGLPNVGSITPPQAASNAEIDSARKYLTDSGMSMDEIIRRTQDAFNLGRENPDYDPYMASTYRLAMQRKVGDDPDFASFQQRYRGGGSAGSAATAASRGSGTEADPFTPTTPEEFAVIRPGEIYRDPGDGQLYRKK